MVILICDGRMMSYDLVIYQPKKHISEVLILENRKSGIVNLTSTCLN